jgi:hypothetical protein
VALNVESEILAHYSQTDYSEAIAAHLSSKIGLLEYQECRRPLKRELSDLQTSQDITGGLQIVKICGPPDDEIFVSDTSTFKKYRLIACISAGLAAGLCNAQTLAVARNTLTNHSIVTLAKAGFDEDFIIDTILSGRTQFDTSVDGLADLAKQGITERLIRVMMNPAVAVSAAGMSVAPAPMPALAVAPPSPERQKVSIAKTSAVKTAVATHTPYYQTSSFFFGVFKRRVGVGVAPGSVPAAAPHLGMLYENVRLPHAYLPIGGLPQSYQVLAAAPEYPVQ